MQNIIDQLLEQLPESVRRMTDLHDIVHGIKDHADPLEGCCQCVLTIVRKCQRHVYVVIDRPEVCYTDGAETWRFVRRLLGLVEEGSGEGLKVLLVLRTDRFDVERRLGYLGERPGMLVVKRVDQEEW